jgi:hypothetical protein
VAALFRIRLERSGRALVYHIVAGILGGIAIGVIAALLLVPIDWVTSREELEGVGYSIFSLAAVWLVLAPWTTTVFGLLMILSSTLPLILLKDPGRRVVLFSSSSAAGLVVGIVTGVAYVWGILEGTLLQACLVGFVVGALMAGSIAELFYRRYTSGTMPRPWVGFLLGAGVGLANGLITSPFHPWDSTSFWIVGSTVGFLAIVGGVNLAVFNADKFIAGLSAEESRGGWFK